MPKINIEVATPKELKITERQKRSLRKAFKLEVVNTFDVKDDEVIVEYESPVQPIARPRSAKK